ncbi:hypothetical protein [Amycolatopsis sp. PS_44_ISF1]|uniref:hypothetical protein n=1 Tax=Amycolatopsis sp. PS_44_ISF1 TaxID=2974917 RepID=UPI0028DD580C|nr:hypothetical protein [Amycolatopsis sp. PS_44_ISF1]MDT8910498.1 hypothetical protein [Amycolatopsis sp. PS_44_ISF1]
MGKNAARITALVITAAVPGLSAAIALPGTAAAAPGPTLGGSCPATLQNSRPGHGLTVDAGAPLDAPDRLTVGLDSKSKQADGHGPRLKLPVGDVTRALGVGELPVVGDVVGQIVCPVVQSAVDVVGDTTQGLVSGLQDARPEPPGSTPPDEPDPDQPGPDQPDPNQPGPDQPAPGRPGPGDPAPGRTEPAPGDPGPSHPKSGGSTVEPVVTGPGDVLSGLDPAPGTFTNAAMLPAGFVQAPVITQVIPGRVPTDQPPTVDAKKSGTAQALPVVNPPARLPMLLAVLALAIVAAALVRAWLRRHPA